ncbi:hypothetical protein N7462_000367 [Penicillium macrosclerotiorum]|uniref:uncharacterized protein n=1 Tax=Penicillium macrosclerotiorum TaxID=303699 RepID=UPI002549724D|nr:uncharacterized protein N7462_000367 [Penicillium macrosclerotiorum]KAJ5698362.1 hypothetical protein N7462_000367 [Penicillium macrosclerotiorum]
MEFDPSRFFRADGSPSPYALLVLNQPINERAFAVLSEHTSHIVCADGASNHFYDLMKAQGKESTELPDAIVGDLDSILPSVRKHYEELGVFILQDEDKYSPDFSKCLKYLNEHAAEIIAAPRYNARESPSNGQPPAKMRKPTQPSSDPMLDIVALGGLGGRVDQAFSQISHLYMVAQTQRELREARGCQSESDDEQKVVDPAAGGNLYLVSEESVTFILQEGKNVIHTPCTNRTDLENPPPSAECLSDEPEVGQKRKRAEKAEQEFFFEENIGIIPLSGPTSISTKGFNWDVQDWPTKLGGQISTSNYIRADKVEVEASKPVLFTVELAQRLKRA